MADKALYCLVYIILLFFSLPYSQALDVCEDHYESCPVTDCGSYPIDILYRTNCMKTCGVCTDVNRALGKPAVQSSTSGGNTQAAVDGYIYSCTSTNDTVTTPSWWCVDLQQVYEIDTIKLHSSTTAQRNLQGFQIMIGLDGLCDALGFTSATRCFTDTSITGQHIYTVTGCDNNSRIPLVGRFVYVTNSGQSKNPGLSLCEVRVTTGTKCNAGYFTNNRSGCIPCSTCVENSCDANTGECRDGCIDGYAGDSCETCSNGRYGPDCKSMCDVDKCRGNCDRKTGNCLQCKPGFYGVNCKIKCSDECIIDRCLKLDGTCFTETLTDSKKPEKTDEGMARSVVGVVGVICGIIVTCLLILAHFIILKRHKLYRLSDDSTINIPTYMAPDPPVRHDSIAMQNNYSLASPIRYTDVDTKVSAGHIDTASDGRRPNSMLESMLNRPSLETPDQTTRTKVSESQKSQCSDYSIEYQNESLNLDDESPYDSVKNPKSKIEHE